MSIEPKFDTVGFAIVKIVAVVLGPNDVESTALTRPEADLERNIQFWLRSESTVEIVVTDERFGFEKDISDRHQCIVIDWTRVAQHPSHD